MMCWDYTGEVKRCFVDRCIRKGGLLLPGQRHTLTSIKHAKNSHGVFSSSSVKEEQNWNHMCHLKTRSMISIIALRKVDAKHYLSSSKTTVLSYGPTRSSPRSISFPLGWKVTLYPRTSPGAGSQDTRKLVLVGSEVCRFLGALYGDTVGWREGGDISTCKYCKNTAITVGILYFVFHTIKFYATRFVYFLSK